MVRAGITLPVLSGATSVMKSIFDLRLLDDPWMREDDTEDPSIMYQDRVPSDQSGMKRLGS